MTHFTVLVKSELESGDLADMEGRIAEMLEPYDEGKIGEKRKVRMKRAEILRACKHYNVPNSNVVTLTPEQLKEYFGSVVEKDGRGYFYWSTYNKLSKWDWYEIGGRWQGMLMLKDGALGRYNKRPHMNSMSLKEAMMREKGEGGGRVDVAFLKDVDLDAMEASELAGTTEDYYKAVEMVVANLERGSKFDDLAATLYFEYGIEDESLEERLARVGKFSTHAVVDEKGWHEWSRMGWWGVHTDEKETQETWNAKFRERFMSNPTDKTVVAVVDAHI